MEFNTLTRTLNDFIAVFNGAYSRLAPYALGLLGLLLVIDLALTGSWTALGEFGPAQLAKHLLTLGGWTYLTMNFQFLAKAFVESVIQAGLVGGGAAGTDHSLLLDPSKIAGMGLEATEPILTALQRASIFAKGGVGITLIMGAGYLVLIACYFLMAIQVFLAVIEYYLILAIVGVLVPFGAWAPTRFISEKAIGAVVSHGIKLMVLSLILAATGPFLGRVTRSVGEAAAASNGHLTINALLGAALAAICVAGMTWKGPTLAAGLLGGSPSLAASDAARSATSATGATVALGTGVGGAAVAATKAATTVAAAGGRGAATLAGAASTGARLGAATSTGGRLSQLAGGALGAARGVAGALADGASGLARRAASPAPGGQSAFQRGEMAAFRPVQPVKPGQAPASTASSAPASGWSAQLGGYAPAVTGAEERPPAPIHIGTEPAHNRAAFVPPAPDPENGPPTPSAPPAAPLAAPAPPPSPPTPTSSGGAPPATPAVAYVPPGPPPPPAAALPLPAQHAAGTSAARPTPTVISPPAWADQAGEQIRLMSQLSQKRPPPTA